MTIPQVIRKNGVVSAAAFVAIAVGALLLSFLRWSGAGRPALPRFSNNAFYTIDDGASLFVDDKNKVCPFDHEGHQAVLAFVYTCDGGRHRFVQYLQKYDEPAKAAAAALQSSGGSGSAPINGILSGLLVKRPGDKKWVHMTDRAAQDILLPVCPEGLGDGPARQLFP